MSIEQIFNGLGSLAQLCHNQSITAKTKYARDLWNDMDSVATEAITLLRTHPEAQPNEPLTLEELREMDGQPVWVKVIDHTVFADKEDDFDGWGMCRSFGARVWDGKRADIVHVDYEFEAYGKEWLAYRRPPKEVQ